MSVQAPCKLKASDYKSGTKPVWCPGCGDFHVFLSMTKAAAAAHKGRGLMGVARDNLPREGQTYGFMAAFAEVEVDLETGVWTITDFAGVADVGTVIHPHSLGGQINGGSIQGIGHIRSQKLVYDPHYGAGLSTRMHHNKPPTILDIPQRSQWAAVGQIGRAHV